MVKAWKEKVVIPTYEVGDPEKLPMFLEKRVYQGSSGAVYPYPVIESVADEKVDKEYSAVFIENEYIKVMILPELGGRVQMAYDKVAKRHFIYYNHVVKPALVGLAGPWISGGIEFNWPQHHRPSTFMPVDCDIEENADGSVTVWVSEMERMSHQKGMAGFTLRPGCARLEINGVLYNRTDVPQTFLWWANPAVAVNDHYQSVFPPDINAVFDHGKRAVSSFPIATGTYYKMDYSAGVDISNYKNIKVPTSYMGVNSRYNFEGGYENDTRAGMLHVADHHVSPGKKQWTWGNGDFGRAWDRNLTDEDGPYIELMAGVYTENQPDFAWLQPYEEKRFTQYFFPYRELGIVKNASRDFVVNVEETEAGKAVLKVFATRALSPKITLKTLGGETLLEVNENVSPEKIFVREVDLKGASLADLSLEIENEGKVVLTWEPEPDEIKQIPDAAVAAPDPEEIRTVEMLYLTGLHLEQYRHATFSPLDYYEEGLRREPSDVRCNNAMGLWNLKRGEFAKAEEYFRRAVKTQRRYNPNPYDGEPMYNLGVALKMQRRLQEAYDCFAKACWNAAWQDAGYYNCAMISHTLGNEDEALKNIEKGLIRNAHNNKALALKVEVLRCEGKMAEALTAAEKALEIDPFNFAAMWERYLITGEDADKQRFVDMMRDSAHNYNEVALELAWDGAFEAAVKLWQLAEERGAVNPMSFYHLAWTLKEGELAGADEALAKGAKANPDYCFPNAMEDVVSLRNAIAENPMDGNAIYYLGLLLYAGRKHSQAIELWNEAKKLITDYAPLWRSLALGFYNVYNQKERALEYMEKAFALDPKSSRLLMELDQLRKKMGVSAEERLEAFERVPELIAERDDLMLERGTLLNLLGRYDEARELFANRQFHPWEGGEGKVSSQYQFCRAEKAKEEIAAGNLDAAETLLTECLEFPENLGEGKLYGAQDNDFDYLLGCIADAKGDKVKAEEYWKRATEGPSEPVPALYYNDARPDKIFYQGMALRALGDENGARGRFHRLITFGEKHIFDKFKMDYFAVSLPDLLIWDEDMDIRNEIHCRYMIALGSFGLGNVKRCESELEKVLALDPCHQGALALKSFMKL